MHNYFRDSKQYEKVSRQQINFVKSSLQFGEVEESTKIESKSVLGISNIGGMGTYLGYGNLIQKNSLSRDILQNIINEWSAKFLSKGEKEMMTKFVVVALPTYAMYCFWLPNAITSKITSVVAKFW